MWKIINKGRVVFLFGLALAGCALSCDSDRAKDRETGQVLFRMVLSEVPDNKMDYYYVLFRAEVKKQADIKDIPDSQFELIRQSGQALSKQELDTLSFQFQNHEIEEKVYKLIVLATPSEHNETTFASVSGNSLQVGDRFTDVCISMVTGADNTYRMLSKDNYYAEHVFSGMDIVSNNILTISTKLERLVGQLVYDIFKVENNAISQPADTEDGIGSVLDRVYKIDIRTSSFSCNYPFSVDIQPTNSLSESVDLRIQAVLNASDLCLYPEEQDPDKIKGPVFKEGYGDVKGSVRIYGPFLLPSEGISVQSSLIFTYYDTTQLNDEYDLKEMSLFLPSGNKKLLIKSNCYTVTNIGISQNRIIDLNISGGISIDPVWE